MQAKSICNQVSQADIIFVRPLLCEGKWMLHRLLGSRTICCFPRHLMPMNQPRDAETSLQRLSFTHLILTSFKVNIKQRIKFAYRYCVINAGNKYPVNIDTSRYDGSTDDNDECRDKQLNKLSSIVVNKRKVFCMESGIQCNIANRPHHMAIIIKLRGKRQPKSQR